jgi:CRISPR-associated protein Cas4
MFNYLRISNLNDFIFCPYSIYLHNIYDGFVQKTFQSKNQTRGKISHKNIDEQKYSTSKHILQGTTVYHNEYRILGKIDLFDKNKKTLIERKYFIKEIYYGYKLQLYAQYFCLIDMGFEVEKLRFHSMKDNKNYEIDLPNNTEKIKFEKFLKEMRNFSSQKDFKINKNKCKNCIYATLCERSQC